jgi:hypothetical protein
MKYDKFYDDKAYMMKQYRLAEPHLNIISNSPGAAASTDEAAKKAALASLRAIYADRVPEQKWAEIDRLLRLEHQKMTAEQLGHMVRDAIDQPETVGTSRPEASRSTHGRKREKPVRRTRRTAPNGGMAVESPFQTRIVTEQELVPLLNQGWEVLRELASGKIIVRRPNHLDEWALVEVGGRSHTPKTGTCP